MTVNTVGSNAELVADARVIGVSPEDYGAINDFGQTDSTAAIMAAFNAAKSMNRPLIWSGNYGATHLDFNQPNGVTIIGGGTLTGLSSDPQESVLTLRNFADFRLYGRLVVSASYKTTYAAGVAIYTDTGGGASQFDISGLTVVGSQVGIRIGRRSEPDALLSEATFFGGNFYGCPTCYELIGTQTVINFMGCNMITGVNGAIDPAAWAQLPRTAVRSFGASYVITGGEALIVDVATGLLFDNRPIASTSFGNRYGNMSLNNCTIESASQICLFWNPEAIPSLMPGTGSARMINCDGFHSQNALPIIQTYDDFTGSITAQANPIFSSVTRTVDNVSVGLAACDIYIDDNSFGKNFKRGLAGVSGGNLHFSYRQITELQNFNGQALPIGETDLKPTTMITTGDLARSFVSYDAGTGEMTTLQGFRTLTVTAQFQTASLTTGDTYVTVNGIKVGIIANNRSMQISRTLHEVAAGAKIKIQVGNTGNSGQAAQAGATGFVQLSASNI